MDIIDAIDYISMGRKGRVGGIVEGARLSELAACLREFGDGGEPQRLLEDDALALAADLFAQVDGRPAPMSFTPLRRW
ncbi:hypothetical protein SSP24_66830 [Streptomyces spinoverrucosus]|uniref:Uncharacterized protein n=1 Tax=Streptomyces spinoverrucosus TaxID=284043 RepID=A0A4Y3VS31_9ACTN|nr:hypothetical protein [Streptomyces spinoverrucosus]GEC09028.1 hypothetical protein SSP24_66830 [Streptomyces spinoverrucosus]GHB93441.1 hypothetical protein GCM10010397_77730 [Streptomyces spinoverrucosus]